MSQSAPAHNRRWPIWVAAALAAVAILLGVNTYAVNSKTRAADARDGGAIVDTEVVPANVEVEGDGPPIVLIHGFGAAIDWWDEIAPALAANHRVIRVDLIGHGGMEAVLDQLGVGRVTVIGHSMGGEVAPAFAEIEPHRVERMVLIDSPPSADTTFTTPDKTLDLIDSFVKNAQNP